MAKRKIWTREELILAFNLYLNLPIGKMHKRTPEVLALANLFNRTSSSIALRLANYIACDPFHLARGIKGMDGGKKQCQPIWDEFSNNREGLIFECDRILAEMKIVNIGFENNLIIGEVKNQKMKSKKNENISNLFKLKDEPLFIEESNILCEPFIKNRIDNLHNLTDKILINKIKPLLKRNKVLEAVEVCSNFYKGEYKSMTFKDWFKIVKELYDNNTFATEFNDNKILYSDKELYEFEIIIGKKIIEATNKLTKLKLEEKIDKNILNKQRKYIEELEAALIRIENKTYGICSVTGKLIAKERLIAVPHTSISMKGKLQQNNK